MHQSKTEYRIPGNASQVRAIRHKDGPCCVLAGPGSGKTFVIVQRLKYLIEHCGVPPSRILTITFTRAAAQEMKQRFDKLTDHRYPETPFGTFHSVFYHILKTSGHPAEEPPGILTETEKQKIMKMILTDLHDSHPEIVCSPDLCNLWLSEIARRKGEGTDPSACSTDCSISDIPYREYFPDAYQEYQKICGELSKLDFEDMIGKCLRLFHEKPEILRQWREHFQYIQIDEYQDINKMQSEVVTLLAAPANNLFVVGDDDQSIYGFRGSRPDIMLAFDQMYPGAQRILLGVNYRCRKSILDASALVIRENRVRFDKEMKPGRTEEAGEIDVFACTDREGEAEKIREAYLRSREEHRSFCIIVRTNAHAQKLADLLAKDGIKSACREVRNPYTSDEIQDIRAYLNLSVRVSVEDLLRILNRPSRYLSRESIRGGADLFSQMHTYYSGRPALNAAVSRLERDIRMLSNMRPALALRYIRTVVGYDLYLKNSSKIQDPQAAIKQLDDLQKEAEDFSRTELFVRHIEESAAKSPTTAAMQKYLQTADDIRVITMHAAKGLEFDTVWIPSVNEGILPSRKSVTPEQIEEERRLFYVAMTRARRRLYISYLTGDDNYAYVPSRFLRPLKGSVVRQPDRVTASDR